MNFNKFKLPHRKLDNLTNVKCNELIVKYIRTCAWICGLEVYLPDFKLNWRAALLIILSHPVIISYIFILFSDESVRFKLEGLCNIIIWSQGVQKFWTTFLGPKYFLCVFNKIEALHKQYVDDQILAPQFKKICFYWMVIFQFLAFCYLSLGFAYYIFPVLMWVLFGELVTIFPFPLPLIDWRSTMGYTINIIQQVCIVFYGVVGIAAADAMFLYQILHTIVYLNIFSHRVKQLNEMIECKPQDLKQIEAQLYECIKAHQDYISYIEMVDKNYSQLCFGQLMTSQLALLLSLFMTLWSKWIVGPFISVAVLFQVLEYCILGTVVTIQNERASEIIYDIYWYLLPVRLQKNIILMIARGQSPAELHVGGFAKLNVETAMKVITSTYQYLMMMLEFIE